MLFNLRLSILGLTIFMFFLIVGSLTPCVTAQEVPPASVPQMPDASDRQRSRETEQAEKEMRKQANKERQAKLKKDTDELLKLATQLKEYVDKTNENVLSLDVVKKAEQIEKLARSVKEKMRSSY